MTQAIDVIFCDDIRNEDNGKQIAIGVYGNDIILNNPSNQIALVLWIRFLGFETGKHKNTIEIYLGNDLLLAADGEIEAEEGMFSQVQLPGFVLKVDREDTLRVVVTLADGVKLNAPSTNVKFGELAGGAAPT
ncbi:hypothetical protein [Sulfitobacter mediterraneus]|uniref:Uncharacterized protein n=1 Tax=Sulfitobacter mediterraneus TaxID=83219 RepID=A0A061SQZ8_9RHOB|nr:hypothetical protein [Sulfitobacter mediterraneus]KAJ03292.1 hypothetical protein PM02_10435 [Sulfitobacter mediterraneus]